jgi:hypothetical protein
VITPKGADLRAASFHFNARLFWNDRTASHNGAFVASARSSDPNQVPADLNTDKIDASFKNGVLTVT